MFNTLKYAKMLEAVGFSREQSETTIKILAETMEDKLASKQDMKELRTEFRNEVQEIRHDIQQMKSELTIRMGTMMAASIAVLTALQKFL